MATLAQIDSQYPGQDFQRDGSHGLGSGDTSSNGGIMSAFYDRIGKKSMSDGQAPKRRGPKPNSTPAMTRRQELNRQAQRTHRERKEQYVKLLEAEVMKLRESYSSNGREIEWLRNEIRRLQQILQAHDIEFDSQGQHAASTVGSVSGASNGAPSTGLTIPSPVPHMATLPNGFDQQRHQNGNMTIPRQMPNTGIDYDQVGINFVLALERPCMDHMQMLCVASASSDEHMSGHALMASAPPTQHVRDHPDVKYPHKIDDDMAAGDILRLLDLSNRLPLDGEITPVMAWAMVINDGQFAAFTHDDFTRIQENLMPKVRCYGFGAVLEEFEVRDAIEDIILGRLKMFTGLAMN